MDSPDPSPTDDALARLSKLTVAGTPPERVVQEVGEMVAAWAGEAEMDAATAQERIGLLWDSMSKDAADLEEAISDADGTEGEDLASAKRVLAAMQAAVNALAAAHGRL